MLATKWTFPDMTDNNHHKKTDMQATNRILSTKPLRFGLTLVVLLVLPLSQAVAKQSIPPASEQSVRPGVNNGYLNPNLNVDKWMRRFEIESREVFAQRLTVLKAIGLQPGQHIADIGAGTGFYTELFAETTGPTGHVYAVDIAPNFLKRINKRSQARKLTNVTSVLGRENSITLPAGSLDKAFTCNVYHHLEYPKTSLASIYKALKPGGELIVIDFERIPGKSSSWVLNHMRAGEDVFSSEISGAGFQFVEKVTIPGFKENYFLRFKKP